MFFFDFSWRLGPSRPSKGKKKTVGKHIWFWPFGAHGFVGQLSQSRLKKPFDTHHSHALQHFDLWIGGEAKFHVIDFHLLLIVFVLESITPFWHRKIPHSSNVPENVFKLCQSFQSSVT